MFPRTELTTEPLHCASLRKDCSRLAVSRRSRLRSRKRRRHSAVATTSGIRDTSPMAASASACNLPTKQDCAFAKNAQYQPVLGPTTPVRARPMTGLACTRSKTAKKPATQAFQARRAKGIASEYSRIRCARDDDESRFQRALVWSNDVGW